MSELRLWHGFEERARWFRRPVYRLNVRLIAAESAMAVIDRHRLRHDELYVGPPAEEFDSKCLSRLELAREAASDGNHAKARLLRREAFRFRRLALRETRLDVGRALIGASYEAADITELSMILSALIAGAKGLAQKVGALRAYEDGVEDETLTTHRHDEGVHPSGWHRLRREG